MKELAALCNVSAATVSYALRDDSRISESVRLRIKKAAKQHGYVKDSQSGSLVAYRTQGVIAQRYRHIGILYPNQPESRQSRLFEPHRKNIQNTLALYGYDVGEYYLDDFKGEVDGLYQQLQKDGIRGLILAWGQWPKSFLGFPWEQFAVVAAERNEIHPSIDRVSLNHFTATTMAFDQMCGHGCQRIGLVCHDDLPYRVRMNVVGSYFSACDHSTKQNYDIPPYYFKLDESPKRFLRWFEQYQPGAILSHRKINFEFFKSADLDIPGKIPYAVIELDEGPGIESGVLVSSEQGKVIADKISGKLYYSEQVQLSREGTLTLVDGVWNKGKTLSN